MAAVECLAALSTAASVARHVAPALADADESVRPSPATRAILTVLKAGETVHLIDRVEDTFRHYVGCIRHF